MLHFYLNLYICIQHRRRSSYDQDINIFLWQITSFQHFKVIILSVVTMERQMMYLYHKLGIRLHHGKFSYSVKF